MKWIFLIIFISLLPLHGTSAGRWRGSSPPLPRLHGPAFVCCFWFFFSLPGGRLLSCVWRSGTWYAACACLVTLVARRFLRKVPCFVTRGFVCSNCCVYSLCVCLSAVRCHFSSLSSLVPTRRAVTLHLTSPFIYGDAKFY